MCPLEGKNVTSSSNTHSWLLGSHNTPNQSHWLQATLSELDEQTKTMLGLIEEDGDSFAQRAEMYYEKRPELIKMVEEFYKSYRSLAERYDQHVRPDSIRHPGIEYTSDSTADDSDTISNNTPKFDVIYLDKVVDELPSTEEHDEKANVGVEENKDEDNVKESAKVCDEKSAVLSGTENEDMWANLRSQVSMLMEDNLRQQAELIRRNDEKRKAIKDLCLHLDKLMDENKILQRNCLKCSKVGMKQNQSQISKLKALVLGKFLGGTSA